MWLMMLLEVVLAVVAGGGVERERERERERENTQVLISRLYVLLGKEKRAKSLFTLSQRSQVNLP